MGRDVDETFSFIDNELLVCCVGIHSPSSLDFLSINEEVI